MTNWNNPQTSLRCIGWWTLGSGGTRDQRTWHGDAWHGDFTDTGFDNNCRRPIPVDPAGACLFWTNAVQMVSDTNIFPDCIPSPAQSIYVLWFKRVIDPKRLSQRDDWKHGWYISDSTSWEDWYKASTRLAMSANTLSFTLNFLAFLHPSYLSNPLMEG